jgi:hypothetical protein
MGRFFVELQTRHALLTSGHTERTLWMNSVPRYSFPSLGMQPFSSAGDVLGTMIRLRDG